MRMASLYHISYSDSLSLSIYDKALNLFIKADNKHYEALCYKSIGMLYCQSENYNKAVSNIKQAISIAKEANDSNIFENGYKALCDVYYRQVRYKDVICTYNMLLNLYPKTPISRSTCDRLAISYAKLGYTDSAEKYLDIAPNPMSAEDSISEMRAISELALAKGDFKTYIYLNNIAVDKSDSLLMSSQADKIRESEAKYDMAVKEIDYLTKQRKFVFIIAILSILVIIIGFCVLIYWRREKYARIELEDAISQVTASRQQLEQVLHENQNRLDELKVQEKQLHQMRLLLQQMCETHNDDLEHVEEQLNKTNQTLDAAEISIKIQDQTLVCLDEILRTVFYSGRYNSDQIIDNDSVLNMKPEFWNELYNLVSLKHNDIFARIEAKGIVLNENEKRLIALSVANLPRAIIRRILGLKSIQVVSNRRQKLAKKITGGNSNFDKIFQ